MHQSRLSGIMIDCSLDTIDASVQFWSQALGVAPILADDPTDPFVTLPDAAEGLRVELQRIDAPSRIHLDIETDNVEVEVQRLEALGATRVAQIETWQVMRDPSGRLFCVVEAPSRDFAAKARRWE